MSQPHLPGPLRIGERYKNKYDILELLGAGGQGTVYRAHHCLKKQDVAIKVVAGRDPEAMFRGAREAESLARLNHPNIPGLFDAEIDDGFLLLVMEYLKGRPYKAALKEHGKLGVQEVLELSIQAAEALAFMHEQGVIHRDVKPENIYIASGNQVKILDFGIAKVEDEKAKTQRNIVLGTRPYVPPEQLQGLPVSHYSDQFALGVVEYIALCGIHPTDQVLAAKGLTPNAQNRMEVQCLVMPTPLHQLNPEIDLYVSQVVQRSIAKVPSQRFGSMRHKADALRECLRCYLRDHDHTERRAVRDLSLPGNVPLLRYSSERRQGEPIPSRSTAISNASRALEPVHGSQQIGTHRDLLPTTSHCPAGPGQTEPLRPIEITPRRLKAVSWRRDEQHAPAPDPNLYGPRGTLRVVSPPVARRWAAEMLAHENTPYRVPPGVISEDRPSNHVPPPERPEQSPEHLHNAPPLVHIARANALALRVGGARESQVAPAPSRAVLRAPVNTTPCSSDDKPRTPAPVSIRIKKRQLPWGSVRPLFALGIVIGTTATSVSVAVMWGATWLGHRALTPAAAKGSQVRLTRITQETPAAAPALSLSANASPPTAPIALDTARPIPVPAAATPPTPVLNRPLRKASPTVAAASISKPPAGVSSSQRAHESEVARMRERTNDLENDLGDSKGPSSIW